MQCRLNSVERYDPESKTWHYVAPMSSNRDYLSASVVNGSLYVIGGYDGSQRLDLVERYDAATDQWSVVTCMSVRRDGLASAVLEVDVPAQ